MSLKNILMCIVNVLKLLWRNGFYIIYNYNNQIIIFYLNELLKCVIYF